MFPGKEELIQLEKFAQDQVQIYNDSADHGIILNESRKVMLRNIVQNLRKIYQSEIVRYGNQLPGRSESFGGSETEIWITQEEDDGIYRGTKVEIGYHRDAISSIEFISINFESWSGESDTFLEN